MLPRSVRGHLEIAGEVHLHPVSFPNGHGRKAIEESAHHLKGGLRRRVRASCDDDGPIARSTRKPSTAEPLSQSADEADSGGRPERRPIVVIDLVPQPGIPDLVETHELVETQRAAIRHQESMEDNGESGLAQCLHGPCLAQNSGSSGNQDVLAAVREHGVRDQTIHW